MPRVLSVSCLWTCLLSLVGSRVTAFTDRSGAPAGAGAGAGLGCEPGRGRGSRDPHPRGGAAVAFLVALRCPAWGSDLRADLDRQDSWTQGTSAATEVAVLLSPPQVKTFFPGGHAPWEAASHAVGRTRQGEASARSQACPAVAAALSTVRPREQQGLSGAHAGRP